MSFNTSDAPERLVQFNVMQIVTIELLSDMYGRLETLRYKEIDFQAYPQINLQVSARTRTNPFLALLQPSFQDVFLFLQHYASLIHAYTQPEKTELVKTMPVSLHVPNSFSMSSRQE